MAIDKRRLAADAAAVPSKQDNKALKQLTDKGLELERVRTEADRLEAELKVVKERKRELEQHEIPELMSQAGLVSADGKGSFTLKSGAKIYLKNDMFVNVKAEDKPNLLSWLRSHKHKDMIKEDVHHQTLKAFCKEQTEEGGELPPMVTTYFETSAVYMKPKGK